MVLLGKDIKLIPHFPAGLYAGEYSMKTQNTIYAVTSVGILIQAITYGNWTRLIQYAPLQEDLEKFYFR